jgi:hypothetical protein
MENENLNPSEQSEELPDDWWHRVYAAVMITTALVITALWSFTRYFS